MRWIREKTILKSYASKFRQGTVEVNIRQFFGKP